MAMQIGLITEPRRVWELWRQDDGGNQQLVDRYAHRADAEAQMKVFEERGHKQHYWLKEVRRER